MFKNLYMSNYKVSQLCNKDNNYSFVYYVYYDKYNIILNIINIDKDNIYIMFILI